MALLIDTAVPGDTRVEQEEQEKTYKYEDLARELRRLWKVETRVILRVVGALRTVPKDLEKNLRKAGTTVSVE